jgi:hypothetical protein
MTEDAKIPAAQNTFEAVPWRGMEASEGSKDVGKVRNNSADLLNSK